MQQADGAIIWRDLSLVIEDHKSFNVGTTDVIGLALGGVVQMIKSPETALVSIHSISFIACCHYGEEVFSQVWQLNLLGFDVMLCVIREHSIRHSGRKVTLPFQPPEIEIYTPQMPHAGCTRKIVAKEIFIKILDMRLIQSVQRELELGQIPIKMRNCRKVEVCVVSRPLTPKLSQEALGGFWKWIILKVQHIAPQFF